MKRSLAAVLAALVAPLAGAADSTPAAFSVKLAAKDSHEECMRLEKGDRRTYYWRADGPVDFNIHYHRGEQAMYPVKRDAMRGDGGAFTAKSAQDYCWMWTALERPVALEGRISK